MLLALCASHKQSLESDEWETRSSSRCRFPLRPVHRNLTRLPQSSQSSSSPNMSSSGTGTPELDQAIDHTHYRLRTTAGTSYDVATHKIVPVNAPETITFETQSIILSLAVRLRKFTGFPPGSPETSPYFEHP